MTIKEIYEKFDKIGCLSFTTVDEDGNPESRIAHLRAYDDDGIYFQTMFLKPFYKHMKNNGKLSICGYTSTSTEIKHDENGMPVFEGGYTMRMTGMVKEISLDDIKAKNNPMFDLCIKDISKYPAMVTFCIVSGRGEVYDYDFELLARENKIERTYFSYNGAKISLRGCKIDQNVCISCGICKKKCSFAAISCDDGKYSISPYRCDECGGCYLNCPVEAISHE